MLSPLNSVLLSSDEKKLRQAARIFAHSGALVVAKGKVFQSHSGLGLPGIKIDAPKVCDSFTYLDTLGEYLHDLCRECRGEGLIPRQTVDAIACVMSGGEPFGRKFAELAGILTIVLVNKDGTVEGEVEGKHLLLVEDVVTTARSTMRALHALKNAGAASVVCTMALVCYGLEGLEEVFARAGLPLLVLTTVQQIVYEAHMAAEKKVDTEHYRQITQWLNETPIPGFSPPLKII